LFALYGPRYIRRLASTRISGGRFAIFDIILDTIYKITICCSDAVRDAYIANHKHGYTTELVTINNGIDYDQDLLKDDKRDAARKMFSIPPDALVLSNIGRMVGLGSNPSLATDPKAQDVLLGAFAKAFRGDTNTLLLLAGDGRLRSKLQDLVKEMRIQEQVRFLGTVREPWSVLHASDLYCLPSRYEGFPNSLIEAAICGLPVVASDIPEIRNLMLGPEWKLVPPNNETELYKEFCKISHSIQSYSRCAKIAAERYRRAYSMSTCSANYERTFQSMQIFK
jgi:glycosyltransferase involved in cell wall biosynthesis